MIVRVSVILKGILVTVNDALTTCAEVIIGVKDFRLRTSEGSYATIVLRTSNF